MDFEKWFLRNGFGVEVKENYRKCYTKGVEVNAYFFDQRNAILLKVDRGEENIISIYRYTIIMVVNGTSSIPLLHI